jgi:hypothetical protein
MSYDTIPKIFRVLAITDRNRCRDDGLAATDIRPKVGKVDSWGAGVAQDVQRAPICTATLL